MREVGRSGFWEEPHLVHMVNRGSHGAIVLEQWGGEGKGGKGTRRERE